MTEHGKFENIEAEEVTEADRARFETLKHRIATLENKSAVYDGAQKAKAGAFVSLDDDGRIRIERGFVKREDIAAIPAAAANGEPFEGAEKHGDCHDDAIESEAPALEDEEDSGVPDRLMTELTAYRSLALREELANDHAYAYLAVLHALTLQIFYHHYSDSCLQIGAKDLLTSPFPGLNDFAAAKAIDARHQNWEKVLPEQEADLWDFLGTLGEEKRQALFAHCAGLTINAVYEPHVRISGKKRHADKLASALKLDMSQAGWATRAGNYLARVTKAQIIEAVREAKGEKTADLLADLKKSEMALEAERLLDGTGLLPEPLRTPALLDEPAAASLPAFLEDEQLQAAE